MNKLNQVLDGIEIRDEIISTILNGIAPNYHTTEYKKEVKELETAREKLR